ncbi:MAG: glycolate oxidase subunit GlcF [Rhizobiaceae bacterium]
MQTNFTEKQLADPGVAHAEKILRKCVHCGFCTATCPTYLTLGDELDSPRGRIYLIKDTLENNKPADKRFVQHIDRCLSCLACMTTCPSGVNYMHLVDHARAHIQETYRRPLMDRLVRSLLAAVLPYRSRFRLALYGAMLARPFAGLIRNIPGLKPVAAMLALAPGSLPSATGQAATGTHQPGGERKGRVALLSGCAQPVLNPRINEATVELLNNLGIEVVVPNGEVCCGALVHHMGREAESLAAARTNVDVWHAAMSDGGLDAIIITTSGCGTTIKDYGHMLRLDPDYAEKAAAVSALAKDVTEYLSTLQLAESRVGAGLRLAYHSACSMQHGQKIKEQPKTLLRGAGFTVVDIPEGHLCCGSAGTYNILQSDIAATLKQRKLGNIAKVAPDLIAAGNIGCMTQIGADAGVPVIHTVELINWAHGGRVPQGLAKLIETHSRQASQQATAQ